MHEVYQSRGICDCGSDMRVLPETDYIKATDMRYSLSTRFTVLKPCLKLFTYAALVDVFSKLMNILHSLLSLS